MIAPIICFHNADEENGFLSNWFMSPFSSGSIDYSSVEQYMMHQKALVFHDFDIAKKIISQSDANEIKKLGRAVSNYNETVWNGIRQIVVYQGLLMKFRQNSELKKALIETGSAILAECAVNDHIWGIGLGMNDSKRFDLDFWNGQNLLGFSLMEARQELGVEL